MVNTSELHLSLYHFISVCNMEDSVGTTSQEEPSQATEVDSVSVEEPAPAADYADKKVKTEAKKPIKGQSEAIKRKKE